ncbi:hypothetical protein Q31a_14640 [Aureliella helgolandensis]|uniref:Uncharacterized protein n=1 Tax=Aureliella helgolandensis TaxID=2527968 RepID=A0A518G3J2_9BACT|nr:hypothetical protein Q31a_14640 [Aureliella helgolandensis]
MSKTDAGTVHATSVGRNPPASRSALLAFPATFASWHPGRAKASFTVPVGLVRTERWIQTDAATRLIPIPGRT